MSAYNNHPKTTRQRQKNKQNLEDIINYFQTCPATLRKICPICSEADVFSRPSPHQFQWLARFSLRITYHVQLQYNAPTLESHLMPSDSDERLWPAHDRIVCRCPHAYTIYRYILLRRFCNIVKLYSFFVQIRIIWILIFVYVNRCCLCLRFKSKNSGGRNILMRLTERGNSKETLFQIFTSYSQVPRCEEYTVYYLKNWPFNLFVREGCVTISCSLAIRICPYLITLRFYYSIVTICDEVHKVLLSNNTEVCIYSETLI